MREVSSLRAMRFVDEQRYFVRSHGKRCDAPNRYTLGHLRMEVVQRLVHKVNGQKWSTGNGR